MKKKIATVWLAGCSGCHMSLLDMDERILDVLALADIVKSPLVDGKSLPNVDVTIVEGAVGADEHIEEIKHIRQQSKYVVALGDCAVNGNIAAMRNFFPVEEALRRSYADTDNNDIPLIPDGDDILKLEEKVVPLHAYIKVDFFIPGCPPSGDMIFYVLNEILNDRVPNMTTQGGFRNG